MATFSNLKRNSNVSLVSLLFLIVTQNKFEGEYRASPLILQVIEIRHWERMPVTPSLRSRASSEGSEGSGSPDEEILRCAQDDSQDTSHVRS